MSIIEWCPLYCVVPYRVQNCVSFIERCPLYGVSAIEDKIIEL